MPVFVFQEAGKQGANQISSFFFAVPVQEVTIAKTESFCAHVEKTSACPGQSELNNRMGLGKFPSW